MYTVNKISISIALIIIFIASVAYAHKAIIRTEVKDGTVKVECVYSGNSPIMDAKLQVFDMKDRIVSEGRTDKDGKYRFKIPENAKSLKLVVQDLLGHRTSIRLLEEDLTK